MEDIERCADREIEKKRWEARMIWAARGERMK